MWLIKSFVSSLYKRRHFRILQTWPQYRKKVLVPFTNGVLLLCGVLGNLLSGGLRSCTALTTDGNCQ